MKFGNPISDVTATITGGEISLAPGAFVGISGGQLKNPNGVAVQPISDQLTSGDLGNGVDGNITISANATLTRDMQYANLTVNTGVTLNTAGYLIRCQNAIVNNGTISNNGTDANYGAGGIGAPAGSFYGGANGVTNGASGSGKPGENAFPADVQGGAGGSVQTGTQYAGGSITPSGALGLSLSGIRSLLYAGGASGAAYSSSVGTNGADSGGAGGVVVLICDNISGNGIIQANAGQGYTGGSGSSAAAGSGGGITYVICRANNYFGTLEAKGAPVKATGAAPVTQAGFDGRTGILICG